MMKILSADYPSPWALDMGSCFIIARVHRNRGAGPGTDIDTVLHQKLSLTVHVVIGKDFYP
ncbi:MAG: hypothetical protein HXS47_09930 [Theionarchaea archaeon]|nr:hypothetical protein [Theionarchaea archaeon]